jgi:hypothetical protein
MNPFTAKILGFVSGRIGRWLTPLFVAAVAACVVQVAKVSPDAAAKVDQAKVVDFLSDLATGAATAAVGIWTVSKMSKGVETMQEDHNAVVSPEEHLKVDGVPGPKTIAANRKRCSRQAVAFRK